MRVSILKQVTSSSMFRMVSHVIHMLCFIALYGMCSLSIAAGFDAVIFDCDGVLIDSEGAKFKAWQQALKDDEVEFKLAHYEPLVGLDSEGILDAISKQYPDKYLSNDLIDKKNRIYRSLQSKNKPIKDTVRFLKKIAQQKSYKGLKIALVSSASQTEIRENLDKLKINNLFDVVVSGKDDLTHIQDPTGINKPKPYVYQEALSQLQVDPSRVVVFEDTSAGVMAAHAAGLKVIALLNQFTQYQDFSKADVVVNRLQGFYDFLDGYVDLVE